MTSLRGYLDDTGSYFANIISKNGRNEVQIYPINKDASSNSIVIESLIVKVELEAEENVIDACWINEGLGKESSKKRGKRRQSEVEISNGSSNSTSSYLAISIENADILIVSPFKDAIINRISNDSRLVKLSPSLKSSSIWGVDETSRIFEICVRDNKVIKQLKFDEDEKIKVIKTITYKDTSNSNKSNYALLGSNNLYLVDLSKPSKKSLLVKFSEFENPSEISIIKQSKLNPNIIYVIRENEKKVFLYNTSKSKFLTTLEPSSNIQDLQIISNSELEFVMIVTDDGIEVFNIDFDLEHRDQSPIGLIKTRFHESLDKILFSNVFLNNKYELIGVWYNANEPKFTKIDWNFNSVGEIQVPIKYTEKINNSLYPMNDVITIAEPIEINNLPPDELYNKLSGLLNTTSDETNKQEVIKLCSTNDNEDNIKETMKLFISSSEISTFLTNKLFEIICNEIACDPSKSSSLSSWLKWLLLAHGGCIAKDPDQYENLKKLQNGLTEGLKLMPRLLALQGRLQLLRSQAELRERISTNNENDSEDEAEGEDQVEEDKESDDENIIYANGENDDFEDAEVIDEDHGDHVNGVANEDEEETLED